MKATAKSMTSDAGQVDQDSAARGVGGGALVAISTVGSFLVSARRWVR